MHQISAQEAFTREELNGRPMGQSSRFVCPHCRTFSQQNWGGVEALAVYYRSSGSGYRETSHSPLVALACCAACENETVFCDGQLVYPSFVDAPLPASDMPEEVKDDFEEARLIYTLSPRGAAALLRLVIQKLCPIIGSTEKDINKAIGDLVAQGKIPAVVQQALDSVRVIGNEAVHPGTMDLKDDHQMAKSLFGLVNFIIEKAFTEPKKIAEIYGALPANKLAGIAQRDAKNQNKP